MDWWMRIALGGYRGRLTGFFQDRAHILVYRRLYCNKCLFVPVSNRGLAKAGRERINRDDDSEQRLGTT